MITYKCKDHCKISDFNALKEEFKGEMGRFNNVKKYVTLLTDKIVEYKGVIKKLMKYAPKKQVKAIITTDLNLEPDDPLLAAADLLSDPGTPKISERFNIEDNVKNDAKKQIKDKNQKIAEKERKKLEKQHKEITKLQVLYT